MPRKKKATEKATEIEIKRIEVKCCDPDGFGANFAADVEKMLEAQRKEQQDPKASAKRYQAAFDVVTSAIHADRSLRLAWERSIAVRCKDEVRRALHDIQPKIDKACERAARGFIAELFRKSEGRR